MKNVNVVIFMLFSGALIGLIVSLAALLPPVRRWARRAPATRIAAIAIAGLAAGLIAYAGFSRLAGEAEMAFRQVCPASDAHRTLTDPATGMCVDWSEDREARLKRIQLEYWLRVALPFNAACYSDADTCNGADGLMQVLHPRTRGGDPNAGLVALAALASAGVLAWRFTRPERNP